MCSHTPRCPTAGSPDQEAARAIARHHEQGWGLLCNGVLVFEDTGDLQLDGTITAPRRMSFVGAPGAQLLKEKR
ncbi:DUF5999 family protein [Streptomyces sp. NPDC051644]|uniref:DUF5999 family protein n=1 Tax=Streptomyces sp. NPDC051644 TaxID=3365666 RepID=UPI0037A87CC0